MLDFFLLLFLLRQSVSYVAPGQPQTPGLSGPPTTQPLERKISLVFSRLQIGKSAFLPRLLSLKTLRT